jgi:tetratricopeptide (TPR) repeat protein
VSGEVEYSVPSLQAPEAVFLFCERAQLEPSSEIADLCSRLDALPLAVELAAARTKALSPAQILERLAQRLDLLKGDRDADPRQQTLRATIEWSYELLTEDEQRLFRNLSVFAGGCILEAAEEVVDADLDTLQSLVEKSLVRFTNERYWMLETIREYAGEQLGESQEGREIHQKHSLWVLALSEHAGEALLAAEAREWLPTLDAELNNFRAALTWFKQTAQSEAQLDLVSRIWTFWRLRGNWLEGQRWTRDALDRAPTQNLQRAKVLRAAGAFTLLLDDARAAKAFEEESLAILRKLEEPASVRERIAALTSLGVTEIELGDLARGAHLLEEAAALARETGDTYQLAYATANLGETALRAGDHHALALAEDALTLFRELGNEPDLCWALYNYALCLFRAERDDECLSTAKESSILAHSLGDVQLLMWNVLLLASLAARREQSEIGAMLLGAADVMQAEMDMMLTGVEAELHREAVENLHSALGDGAFEAALAAGQAMPTEELIPYAVATLN